MTDQTRAAFEAHFQLTTRQAWQHPDGSYKFPEIQAKWEGYLAGVAKAAPVADDKDKRIEVLERCLLQAQNAAIELAATPAGQDTARINYLERWRQEGNKARPHVQFEEFGFELWVSMREQLDRLIELEQRHKPDDEDE